MIMIRRLSALAATAGVALAVGGTAAPATAATSSPPASWISTAISLPGAQQATDGSGITVAVIDTGTVDLSQFGGSVTEGPSYVSGGGDPGEEDHGTEMANLVLQVAPGAHILAIRAISGGTGATASNLTSCPVGSAVDYAAAHGAKVINLSLGSNSGDVTGYTACEAKAVEQALAAGVTVLAAAGNNGTTSDFTNGGSGSDGEDDESFPAGFTGVIAVAALSQSGSQADFSTVHSYNDVGAPGVDISTVDGNGATVTEDGTSEATPLVAGVAALILSKAPDLAPYQVAAAIEQTASHPGGWTAETGYGEVNAAAALAAAEKMTPAAPTQASVSYPGPAYFAGGSGSGSASTTDTGGYVHAGILFILALLSLGGAFLLIRRRRRTAVVLGEGRWARER
jgi:subtilisin family serine protease